MNKYIGIVGSRVLFNDGLADIDRLVKLVITRGNGVISGGADGADLFALEAVVRFGKEACERSRVELPWNAIESAPVKCRSWLKDFERLGGLISYGSFVGRLSSKPEVIKALFERDERVVEAIRDSGGVLVPFSTAEDPDSPGLYLPLLSRGTGHTVDYADKLGVPVFTPAKLFSLYGMAPPKGVYWEGDRAQRLLATARKGKKFDTDDPDTVE